VYAAPRPSLCAFLRVLKDDQSRGFYLKVARRVPRDVIYQLISEIRADIINNPQSEIQNPASIFTKRIKELAAKRGDRALILCQHVCYASGGSSIKKTTVNVAFFFQLNPKILSIKYFLIRAHSSLHSTEKSIAPQCFFASSLCRFEAVSLRDEYARNPKGAPLRSFL